MGEFYLFVALICWFPPCKGLDHQAQLKVFVSSIILWNVLSIVHVEDFKAASGTL